MDMITNIAMAYPGFAFAGAAAALWGARYVVKIKTENQHMKAETDRGERAPEPVHSGAHDRAHHRAAAQKRRAEREFCRRRRRRRATRHAARACGH